MTKKKHDAWVVRLAKALVELWAEGEAKVEGSLDEPGFLPNLRFFLRLPEGQLNFHLTRPLNVEVSAGPGLSFRWNASAEFSADGLLCLADDLRTVAAALDAMGYAESSVKVEEFANVLRGAA